MARPEASPGLVDALQRLAGSALALLSSRLELLRLEFDAARQRLVVTLLAAFGAALLAAAALLALSAWFALSLWERFGPAVLGLLALGYALAAALLIVWLRARLAAAPAAFADTLAELRRDAQGLRGEPGRGRDSP